MMLSFAASSIVRKRLYLYIVEVECNQLHGKHGITPVHAIRLYDYRQSKVVFGGHDLGVVCDDCICLAGLTSSNSSMPTAFRV